MTTIALDSSTEVCSAALVADGAVVAERINRIGSNHAALLPAYVQELQAEAKQRGLTIDGIVLSEGPGSYTGLRIGASLAKGLCYGADLPLYAVPTLAVIAFSGLGVSGLGNERVSGMICPMIDARRMEVYCALYRIEETADAQRQKTAALKEERPLEAKVIDGTSFAEVLDEHIIYFCGNGAEKCKAVINHPHARWIDGIVPTAAEAGRLAEEGLVRVIEGKDIAYFEPNYLKEFIAAPSHVKGLSVSS